MPLRNYIKAGHVYRRSDLEYFSASIDRHLAQLTKEGCLQKLQHGLYYAPLASKFGSVPPADSKIIRAFLKDDRFLMVSPNDYNSLGLGLTQLYNTHWVYNHKRSGAFKFASKQFEFKLKASFPNLLTKEFLIIDLLNNLSALAENHSSILTKLETQLHEFEVPALILNAQLYGDGQTKKTLKQLIRNNDRIQINIRPQ